MKKIWIVSGEESGDIYGANLARELKALAAANGEELKLSGMGGARMIAAGVDVLVDTFPAFRVPLETTGGTR